MSTTQSHWIMLALLMGLIPAYSKKSSEVTPDCGGTHVCTTLMRYRDNTTVDEGNNCICREGPEACSKLWEESDPKSLTWQHYERAHWSVQYKFCTPVFAAKSVCRPGEMAAVVETDVKTWAPYVSTPRCVCEDGGQVKMMGWRREGGVWKYFYFCDKAECPVPSETLAGVSVCAKIYVDVARSTDRVYEMEFLCNCPDGYLCPAKFSDKEDMGSIVADDKGKHVIKMCEPILKKRKKDGAK